MSARGYSLEKRGKNTWRVTVGLGYRNPDGTPARHRETFSASTKTEAHRKAEMIRDRIKAGYLADITKVTVSEVLEDYLGNVAKVVVRHSTHRGYEGVVKNYVNPRIGNVKLADVRVATIEKLYRELSESGNAQGEPLSAKTVRQVHAVLRKAFARAVSHGLIPSNPAQVTTLPKIETKEIEILSKEDFARLTALIDKEENRQLAISLALGLHLGLRRGEVLGLQFGDIDFKKNSLRINRALHRGREYKAVYGDPKTKKSKRTITLTDELREMLLEHREKVRATLIGWGGDLSSSTPVVMHGRGGVVSPNMLTNWAGEFFRKHNFPEGFNFHGLRHTNASYLIAAGVPAKVISERLGHSTIAITLDTYGHLLEGQDEAAAQAFNDLVRSAKGKSE